MMRVRPETVVRWLDDLDCAISALPVIWQARRTSGRRRPVAVIGPGLLAVVLLLGPSAGI